MRSLNVVNSHLATPLLRSNLSISGGRADAKTDIDTRHWSSSSSMSSMTDKTEAVYQGTPPLCMTCSALQVRHHTCWSARLRRIAQAANGNR